MQRIQLSENFFLDEFERSQTAARCGIDNSVKPGGPVYDRLKRLSRDILQPLRDHLGKPITISSGYRSVQLNKKVGGAKNSQHCLGLAADIHVAGITDLELAKTISGLFVYPHDYDQLILEFGQWVHISAPAKWNEARGETYTAVKVPRALRRPATVYVPGLQSQEKALKRARWLI